MEDEKVARFGIVDYILFVTMLLMSAVIGFYHRFTGGRQRTTGEFLLGNRNMGTLPVALSLFASFMSAVTLLSVPAEVYRYGTQYSMMVIAFTVLTPITSYLYIPVFYELNLTSINQYLEKRFNKAVRLCGAIVFLLQMVTYLAVVIYAPSLALSQATGFNVWISVFSILTICSFYTIIGGIKAVMWTDVLQTSVMFIAMIAILIQGLLCVGGFEKMWNIAVAGQRIEFFNTSFSPYVRHSIWTQSIAGTVMWAAIYAVNQAQVQRYMSTKSMTVVRRALWWNLLALWCNMCITIFIGLTVYAYFKDCDPLKSHKIQNYDQILPLFAMTVFENLPGFPGLFLAGLLSGSLSTLSSGLNALAAITLEDFIKGVSAWKDISEAKGAKIAKWLAFGYGLVCLINIFVVRNMGSLVEAALSLFGLLGGPILGLFSLGIFFPWANSWGAGLGTFLGVVLAFWIGIGSTLYSHRVPNLSLLTDGCVENSTLVYNETTLQPTSKTFSFLYDISYTWYSPIVCSTVIISGLLISLITGLNKSSDVDPKLLSPVIRKFFRSEGCSNTRNCTVAIDLIRSPTKEACRHSEKEARL